MSRKLASVQRIVKLEPIEGADLIQKATVLNWQLVTAKDNGFKEGDLVIYVEPDAWVPHEVAPFLSKGQEPREYNGVKGEKLKTIRLRGQVSQGLILPINCLPVAPPQPFDNMPTFISEGDDVTERLGIQKYEPPVPTQLQGQVKGNFPDGVPKTDEDRVQTFKNSEWEELRQYSFEVTEKLEGSSMTVGMLNGEFTVCSRNMNLKETEGNTFWQVARQYRIEETMREFGIDNIMLQGELVGEGVQGNYYSLKGHDFMVFSVFDFAKSEYLSPKDRREMTSKLKLKHVPVMADLELSRFETVQDALAFADGVSCLNQDKLREGVVFKRHDGPEHFKAVSAKYLIKTDK
jgi:RNA ligase (TIGR02306 family)